MSPPQPRRPAPRRRQPPQRQVSGRLLATAAAALAALVVVVVAGLLLRDGGDEASAAGLPRTPDYHSLLVAPDDEDVLVLGTHDGLFRSTDGGRSWQPAELRGNDAMNLARADGATLWAAGHEVLARSTDGGVTWEDVRPAGLPGLDVHAFAVDPRDGQRLLAAAGGRGLYRWPDRRASFALVSDAVGPAVYALALLRDGTLLAADAERGAVLSSRDGGRSWAAAVEGRVLGLAANPARPRLVLASGPGALVSRDGGRSWRRTLSLEAGTGPAAWAPSAPSVGYVVGLDGSLWRTDDAGRTWQPVVSAS